MQKIRNATAVSSANLKSCFETAKILENFDRKLLEEKDCDKKTVFDYYPQLMSHLI